MCVSVSVSLSLCLSLSLSVCVQQPELTKFRHLEGQAVDIDAYLRKLLEARQNITKTNALLEQVQVGSLSPCLCGCVCLLATHPSLVLFLPHPALPQNCVRQTRTNRMTRTVGRVAADMQHTHGKLVEQREKLERLSISGPSMPPAPVAQSEQQQQQQQQQQSEEHVEQEQEKGQDSQQENKAEGNEEKGEKDKAEEKEAGDSKADEKEAE